MESKDLAKRVSDLALAKPNHFVLKSQYIAFHKTTMDPRQMGFLTSTGRIDESGLNEPYESLSPELRYFADLADRIRTLREMQDAFDRAQEDSADRASLFRTP